MYRIVALFVVLILAVLLFVFGKGHTLLLDNKNIKIDDKSYKATHSLMVSVNGGEAISVKKGLRKGIPDMVAGPWHSIKVEVVDKNTVIKTVEKKFSLSLNNMFVLSLPALSEDEPNWIHVFEPPKREE